MQGFEPFELRCETAVAGGVDHQHYPVFEAGAEIDGLLGTQFLRFEIEQ